jgi:acetylornithine deacetylase/succinyl-diaminopimelate desuccinylase-like protein
MPATIHDADLVRIHGANERVAVRDFFEAIRFYRALIGNMTR